MRQSWSGWRFAPARVSIAERSLWQYARYRFIHNRAAVAGVIVFTLLVLFVLLAPLCSPFSYDQLDWGAMRMGPHRSSGHYWGTDPLGRDLLVRIAVGGRVSLVEH